MSIISNTLFTTLSVIARQLVKRLKRKGWREGGGEGEKDGQEDQEAKEEEEDKLRRHTRGRRGSGDVAQWQHNEAMLAKQSKGDKEEEMEKVRSDVERKNTR